jgi:hypothetical protein
MSETNTEQQTQQPESISLNDLQLCLQIVDLASERGAFKGPELSQVGSIRDKLAIFLDYVAQAQADAKAAQEEPEEEAVEEA